jgi:uncharacterized membrane protein HdeD (DUF308 family)
MADQGGTSRGLTEEEGDVLRIIGRSWGWVLFFGIVTLIIGILVITRPKDTVYFIAIVIGIWLFVAGLFRIVMAIADDDETGGTRWLMAFLGLLCVIIGIIFLRRTNQTVTTLAFLLGLFWVIGGIVEFFHAYGDRGLPARGWRLAMGVLAFAAGVVTLVVPHLTLAALAIIMGIWLIIYGLLEIVLSMQLRRLAHA